MAEHFNIVIWLGRRLPPPERLPILRHIFEEIPEVLGTPTEVMLLDTEDGAESHEDWSADSAMLGRTLRAKELLVVYGRRHHDDSGAQPSVRIDESQNSSCITVSFEPQALEEEAIGEIGQRLCVGLSTRAPKAVVLGGWEAELPSDFATAEDIIRRAASFSPSVEWLAYSGSLASSAAGYEAQGSRDGICLLRRSALSRGH